jgi:hypothetical protein
MAATLAGADFRGADLTKSCLFLADVSGAKFDNYTTIDDPENLLKACIKLDGSGNRQNVNAGSNPGIREIADQIPECPIEEDRCGLLAARNGWKCGDGFISGWVPSR